MTYRIIGAVLIIVSSSAVGFSIAAGHKKQVYTIMQLIHALDFMYCELECRMPELPELCRLTAMQVTGSVQNVFSDLYKQLQMQESCDASYCMAAAVKKAEKIPESVKNNLLLLGKTLGRFDLQGQLRGISSVIQLCKRDLDGMLCNQDVRLRSYRTLGICTGVALVIIFI